MIRVLAPVLALLALLSFAAAAIGSDKCERMLRRYERECSVPVPTPKPTHSPKPPSCSEFFFKVNDKHYTRTNVRLEHDVPRTFCVDLPAKSFPFFELYTINKANISCSNLEMTAIAPSGRYTVDTGPAPVLRPNVEAGRWQIKLLLPWGCQNYDFHLAY